MNIHTVINNKNNNNWNSLIVIGLSRSPASDRSRRPPTTTREPWHGATASTICRGTVRMRVRRTWRSARRTLRHRRGLRSRRHRRLRSILCPVRSRVLRPRTRWRYAAAASADLGQTVWRPSRPGKSPRRPSVRLQPSPVPVRRWSTSRPARSASSAGSSLPTNEKRTNVSVKSIIFGCQKLF